MDKLFHVFGDTKEIFFKRIDECGGWPHNAKSVVMRHELNDRRNCYFSSGIVRDEWNTSIYTSDDYHWWKLSDDRKKKHEEEIRYKIRMSI